MIQINSFLRDGNSLVPLGEFRGKIEDPQHIEGAIEMIVGGKRVLSAQTEDYVDQLWEYMVDMMLKVDKESRSSTFYPDQAIELTATRTSSGWLELVLDEKVTRRTVRVVANYDDFMSEFCRAARVFFDSMISILAGTQNELGYRHALARIDLVRFRKPRLSAKPR